MDGLSLPHTARRSRPQGQETERTPVETRSNTAVWPSRISSTTFPMSTAALCSATWRPWWIWGCWFRRDRPTSSFTGWRGRV